MSFVTKNRIKNWLLIFLLVTNAATISTILYHRLRFRMHMHEGNPHQKMKEFIENDLGLSSEQKTKIEKEGRATDSIRETIFDKMGNYRISIYSEFSKPSPDLTVIDSLIKKMSSVFSEIYHLGVSHNIYMLDLCTAEQKVKLKKKYEEMVNDMKAEQQECKKEKDDD
ncbi:MAG: hypothetical protein V1904_00280 [Bacteroidota bacterium]